MTLEAQSWSGQRAAEQPAAERPEERAWVGPVGYLFLLLWTLVLVLLAPPDYTFVAAGIALLANVVFRYLPTGKSTTAPVWRGFRLRRLLLFAGLMILPALISAVEVGPDAQVRAVSGAVLADGARMLVRALVIMVAVNQFANTVSIGEIAALFERAGLHGLGFALGVAVNLFPILRHTMSNTWGSMRMRGGFRRQRLHHLRLFLTTLVYTTLRRAEMIALAAETRAYSPENSHPAPLTRGVLDRYMVVAGTAIVLLTLFL